MSFSRSTREMAHVSGVQAPQSGDGEGEQKAKLTNPNEHQVRLRPVEIAAGCEPSEDQVPTQWLSQAYGVCHLALSSLIPSPAILLPG